MKPQSAVVQCPAQPIAADVEPPWDVRRAPWTSVQGVRIACYPWYRSGRKQETVARVCYTSSALHLHFQCEDVHISARRTSLNSDVCNDSCVEFFAAVAEDPGSYFNLEFNCCGTLHLGYGPGREGRRHITPELAGRIRVSTSVPGPTKEESTSDRGWSLAAAFPLDVLSAFAEQTICVEPGTVWRANFYRCGGVTDPQYACWAPISTPRPDFHRPEYFGRLVFTA